MNHITACGVVLTMLCLLACTERGDRSPDTVGSSPASAEFEPCTDDDLQFDGVATWLDNALGEPQAVCLLEESAEDHCRLGFSEGSGCPTFTEFVISTGWPTSSEPWDGTAVARCGSVDIVRWTYNSEGSTGSTHWFRAADGTFGGSVYDAYSPMCCGGLQVYHLWWGEPNNNSCRDAVYYDRSDFLLDTADTGVAR